MKKIIKSLGVALTAGMLSFGAVSVSLAAEDAGGVVKYIGLSADSSKAALEALKKGDKAAAITALKATRQNTKEITGDAAGMKLQKANQGVKAAMEAVDKDDLAKAIEALEPAVATLEAMKSGK